MYNIFMAWLESLGGDILGGVGSAMLGSLFSGGFVFEIVIIILLFGFVESLLGRLASKII